MLASKRDSRNIEDTLSKGLVIVESPAKAKTIQKYLGKGFTVEASLGHVKDLPKSTLGVDIENDFETGLHRHPGQREGCRQAEEAGQHRRMPSIWRLTRTAKARPSPRISRMNSTATVTGKNRRSEEGRGSAPPRIQRVTFNEITKRAVQAAFEHPAPSISNLVDAQQARRVLDRLVGYKISPLLWDKVRRGLSAGRVQTVALRLIVEREREIRAFEKKEYWTIDAHLAGQQAAGIRRAFRRQGRREDRSQQRRRRGKDPRRAGKGRLGRPIGRARRRSRRNPAPPFTTSKLQQDSSRKLRFSVKRTMMLAQRLYEGMELGEEGSVGLITYMRTDSTRVSRRRDRPKCASTSASDYGPNYLPEAPERLQTKKDAQDAHEAIRPTSALRHPGRGQAVS